MIRFIAQYFPVLRDGEKTRRTRREAEARQRAGRERAGNNMAAHSADSAAHFTGITAKLPELDSKNKEMKRCRPSGRPCPSLPSLCLPSALLQPLHSLILSKALIIVLHVVVFFIVCFTVNIDTPFGMKIDDVEHTDFIGSRYYTLIFQLC